MIYGGSCLSDGVLVSTDTKEVVRELNSNELKFDCKTNHCCITEYGAVVAIVEYKSGYEMIEISTTDFSIEVLKEL